MWVPCPTGCWRRRTMAFRPLLSRLRSPRVLRVPSSPLVLPSSAFAMEQLHSSPACLINMRPWYWDRRTSTGTRPHSPNSNGRASVFSQEKRAYGSKRPSEGVWGTGGGGGADARLPSVSRRPRHHRGLGAETTDPYFSQLWRLEGPDQSARRFGVGGGPLAPQRRASSSGRVLTRRRGRGSSRGLFLKGTIPIHQGSTLMA